MILGDAAEAKPPPATNPSFEIPVLPAIIRFDRGCGCAWRIHQGIEKVAAVKARNAPEFKAGDTLIRTAGEARERVAGKPRTPGKVSEPKVPEEASPSAHNRLQYQ